MIAYKSGDINLRG